MAGCRFPFYTAERHDMHVILKLGNEVSAVEIDKMLVTIGFYERRVKNCALTFGCASGFVGGVLFLPKFFAGRQRRKVQVANPHVGQAGLQTSAIGECVLRTAHTSPGSDITKRVYFRLDQRLKKTGFVKTIDADSGDLKCHRHRHGSACAR